MTETTKIWSFSLLMAAALFAQNGFATYYLRGNSHANSPLPDSSIYNKNDFNVLADFTVCDTCTVQPPGESVLTDSLNINGRHIYIYQVFSPLGNIHKEAVCFGLSDANMQKVEQTLIEGDITCRSDNPRKVPPITENKTIRVWNWKSCSGHKLCDESVIHR